MDDSATTKSRTSSTYASAAVRPRPKRFITGFEAFSEEVLGAGGSSSSVTSGGHAAGFESPLSITRHASPIPSQHPSRSSSLRPDRIRRPTDHEGANDLAASLSGLWDKSWTSLQGLASNVLGADPTSDPFSLQSRSKRASPRSSRPGTSSKQWGPPAPADQPQPGAGSKDQRSAALRAQKRKELLTANANNGSYLSSTKQKYKRRTSDDFGSVSAPPSDSDNRDILIYVHPVKPQDTLAGISIRYNCQMATIKKVNRMWSHDGIQARKTIMIPVASCNIRGRKVTGPDDHFPDLLSGDGPDDYRPSSSSSSSRHLYASDWDMRRDSSATITPETSGSGGGGGGRTKSQGAEPRNGLTKNSEDTPWIHDSWTILEGQTEHTEIARLPRQNFGFFPRTRRRSSSNSSIDRSSVSLDTSRPSITISDTTSSRRVSLHKSRRSSGSNNFATQMLGPGGVGSLKGKGPSTPGPADDKFIKVFSKQIPGMIKIPTAASDDDGGLSSSVTTPSLAEFGNAVEGWAKKLSKGIAKALEAPTPEHVRRQRRAAGFGSTTSGDLIELENSFVIGDDGEDDSRLTVNGYTAARGRRGSLDYSPGGRSQLGSQRRLEPSRSVSHNGTRRKGD